jgi:hypothetical protein
VSQCQELTHPDSALEISDAVFLGIVAMAGGKPRLCIIFFTGARWATGKTQRYFTTMLSKAKACQA